MKPSFCRLSAAGASALSIWELSAPLRAMQDLLGPRFPMEVGKMVLLRKSFAFDEALSWCRVAPKQSSEKCGEKGAAPSLKEGHHFVVEVHLHGGFGVAAALRNLFAQQGWQERAPVNDSDSEFLSATSPLAMRVFAARRDDCWSQHLAALKCKGAEGAQAAKAMQQWNAWGQVLSQPPMLLLAGPPNAGKSTVFNAWLQERRVTASSQAGTTRDLVAAPCQLGQGAEAFVVELVDSAGVWEQAQGVDQAAVAMSLQAIAAAWRIVWLLDASTPPPAAVLDAIAARNSQDLLVVNRSDLPPGWDPGQVLPRTFLRSQQSQLPQLLENVEISLLQQLGPPPPIGQLVAVGVAEREELQALAARDSRRQP